MKPQGRKKSKNTIVGRNKTIVFLVLFCTVIGMMAIVAAKYIRETNTSNGVIAKEFYFSSDILSEDGKTTTLSPTNGKASIDFKLMNHADELRYADVEISYEIKVTSDGKQAGEVIPSTGTIEIGEGKDVSVKLSGLQAGKTYNVTATATKPYTKTLSGTIKVDGMDEQVYSSVTAVTDQYMEVTVWTKDYSGMVNLTYATGLIPDNTDEIMKNWKTSENNSSLETFQMESNTSHVFRFFKTSDNSESGVTVNAQK